MSSQSNPSDLLLTRYLTGDCSAEEAREIEALVARTPSIRKRLDELQPLLRARPAAEGWNLDAMWSEVRERTVSAEANRKGRPGMAYRAPRPTRRKYALAAAAIVILAMGAGGLLVRSRSMPSVPAPGAATKLYATSRGERATIRLVDGTEVTLGPDSRLTIAAGFGDTSREISLAGEALFTVHHNETAPLRIHAHGALVQDIGTRFDLRAYSDEAIVTVAVSEGIVALGSERVDSAGATGNHVSRIELRGGQVGTVDAHGAAVADHTLLASNYVGWANGKLSFVNRPLPEVLRTVGRWYDLDIRVTDARLAHRLVTAEFSAQSPAEIIDALALATEAIVERDGRVVTLKSR
jgi:transmembrane sensor